MKLTISIAVCVAVGWLGSLPTRPALASWYPTLSKPAWTPPNWLFPIAWTALYVTMGVAAWLVWRRSGLVTAAMALFLVQLLLNGIWSVIFFGFHQPGWALLELAILWLAILLTTVAFARSVPLAGWLMVPYLIWVSYAGALNFAIWRLNPVVKG